MRQLEFHPDSHRAATVAARLAHTLAHRAAAAWSGLCAALRPRHPAVTPNATESHSPQLMRVDGVGEDGSSTSLVIWASSTTDAARRARIKGITATTVRPCEIPDARRWPR